MEINFREVRSIIDLSSYIKNAKPEIKQLKKEFIDELNCIINKNLIGSNSKENTFEINFCIRDLLNKYILNEQRIFKHSSNFVDLKNKIKLFNLILNNGKYIFTIEVTKL